MIATVTLNASIDKAYFMKQNIENGTVMRVSSCRNSAGGKGLNVARVIRLCGEEVIATGMVGGYNGKYLEYLLDKDGVSHDFAHISGETRSCINILDQRYGSTEYLEPGCFVTAEEESVFLKKFCHIIEDSSVITISGSAPQGVRKDIYKRMVRKTRERGKSVVLDTSGGLLASGLEGGPTVVKPNKEEIELLFDVQIKNLQDVIKAAARIRKSNVNYVVISLGAEGALMVCEEGVLHGMPPKIETINTVGCGDSMVGAIAVGLERNYSAEEMLRYAVAVASANAVSPHTGTFDLSIFEKILKQVKIEKR